MPAVLPALAALVAALLFVRGWRLLRSDDIEGLDVGDLVLLSREQQKASSGGPMSRMGGALVPALRALLGPKGLRWLDRQVTLAGRPDGATADTVLRNAGTWIVMFGPIAVFTLLSGQFFLALLSVAAIVIMPLARLSRARRVRQERLDRDLPDFLDILSVTVSAGVAFRPALLRVAERYGGPLAEEMTLTLNQMANGASRRTAFTHLRDRNDSEALAQFVTAFLQSEELGAPLAQTLKQIALEMRRSSAQRMRRRAAQAAPRVTLVTSMVLVPGILVLVFVGMYIGSDVDFGSLFGGT
ncbi:type II secretion system F family protein [Kineosporia corallincola]|nr:type II secretion system F family protein [Kineosporia corallincola]